VIADFIDQIREVMRSLGGRKVEVPRDEDPETVDLTEVDARMASWLPYRAYREQDKVFVNRDSLGFVLELEPQSGADLDMAERLKGLYSRLPTDATLQVHLWASPNIAATLRRYANFRPLDEDAAIKAAARAGRPVRNDNIFRTMARRRFAHLQQGSQQPLAPDVAFLVRDFRTFISVTVPGSVKNLDKLDQLLDIRDGMRSTLQAARFPSTVMDAVQLIDLVAEILNPARLRGRPSTPTWYDELNLLSDQMVSRDTTGWWGDPNSTLLESISGKQEDGVEMRSLSVLRMPKKFALWGMSALVGDLFQDSLQVPCPFLLTMGVSIPDQQSMSAAATADKYQAERNATGDLAKYSPGMQEANRHWTNALIALADGGKLVWVYHQILLFARPGQGSRAESAVIDLWRARGFELIQDKYIHRITLLQSMPMMLSKPVVGDLLRFKRFELRTSGNTIHLAPLIAEGKGTGTPTMLGVGRRGQLITLDFFDNTETKKNVSIVGDSGSGKSTLLQEIALAYTSRGALVRVFESGRSFERLTRNIGGQFVRFTRKASINVNPFSMVTDELDLEGDRTGGIDDDVAMLQPMVAKMANPNEPLDPTIYATLATVIKEEYVTHGRKLTITHLMHRYRKGRLYDDRPEDKRYYDMADMLAPFAAGGPYASYFEGPSTLDFSNDFLVFEMQELDNNPHLRTVVQMILLYRVAGEMLQERQRQKVFILDEAKDALAGNGPEDRILAQFLERLYLRIRKTNGCAITATQDVAHYFTSSYGASIWNQSEYILMGKQSENSIDQISKGEAIRMNEHLRRLLTSITTGSGSFREWYVHSTAFKGIMRLVLDPATRLLMSNRAEDNAPLDAALARGLSISDAIAEVLRQRGVEVPQ
jgi:conjugal transfer ATP-binding protein TraC